MEEIFSPGPPSPLFLTGRSEKKRFPFPPFFSPSLFVLEGYFAPSSPFSFSLTRGRQHLLSTPFLFSFFFYRKPPSRLFSPGEDIEKSLPSPLLTPFFLYFSWAGDRGVALPLFFLLFSFSLCAREGEKDSSPFFFFFPNTSLSPLFLFLKAMKRNRRKSNLFPPFPSPPPSFFPFLTTQKGKHPPPFSPSFLFFPLFRRRRRTECPLLPLPSFLLCFSLLPPSPETEWTRSFFPLPPKPSFPPLFPKVVKRESVLPPFPSYFPFPAHNPH